MKEAELNRILTASQAALARGGKLARGHGDTGRTPAARRPRGSVDQSGRWYWTIDHVVRIRAAKSALGALSSKIYLCRQGTKQHDGEK
jgi:hypothetical protein